MLSRILACLVVLAGLAAPALAATMDDVRAAMAEKRMFDAFEDLLDLAPEGDPAAQYELAGFYHWGIVGPIDFTKARTWYERAAQQGNVDAMLGLAVMYGHGQGVTQDRATAFRWLVLASSQDMDPQEAARIAVARDDLAQFLTPQQIDAALAEARSFAPKPE